MEYNRHKRFRSVMPKASLLLSKGDNGLQACTNEYITILAEHNGSHYINQLELHAPS